MTTITIDRAVVEQALDILDSEFTTVDGEFCRWCGRLNVKHNCKLEQTITALRAALAPPNPAQQVVDEQAEDEGLWFRAETAAEAYLQQELRRLHAAVEGEK